LNENCAAQRDWCDLRDCAALVPGFVTLCAPSSFTSRMCVSQSERAPQWRYCLSQRKGAVVNQSVAVTLNRQF
jgi:hypothetical protein